VSFGIHGQVVSASQAVVTPGAVEPVTMLPPCSETIRVAFLALNASDQIGQIQKMIFF